MSEELAIRFNRAELMLISSALATQEDDESKILAIAIYGALNQDTTEEPTPPAVEATPPPVEEPQATPAPDEDFVLRSGPEQASFSDGSVVLRQRMSLHPIFGKISTAILQPDVFRAIFEVQTTINECSRRLKDPVYLNRTTDGDPGSPVDRVRAQLAHTMKLPNA